MTSFSKFIPGFASGSLEIAPALANLNFDFALWKVAAPKEFEGVGSALSTSRRDDAERGMLHTIARKLGALFQLKLPSTPGLTRAYGTRASEIAQALSLDERGRKSYGVFASRAGADATSLWAAATSGTSAISVHLLACMLARMWDAPEAISIWVEIVKRRKEEVIAEFDKDDIAHLATLSAAQQELPRAQIAEWDDSARAWLRVADGVKKKQQIQLMLIVDNVQVPVNKRIDTYESVMEALNNALTQVEALVQGISQQARSGDILLALSSWHLFPDLTVVTPSMTHVRQNDPVFGSGGVLTIGLQAPTVQEKGVHWSLPLAYLRHYGAPVVSAQSIRSELRSRLSLQELLQATLGSLIQGWGAAGKDTLRSLNWISSMYHTLLEGAKLGNDKAAILTRGVAEQSWLALLSEAANLYMVSEGVERQHNNKLISLGRKHGKTFLGTPAAPCFGWLERGSFVNIMASEEERIELLRKVGKHMAEQMRIDSSQIFIRYKHKLSYSRWVYEYATAIPYNTGKKRKADGTSCSTHSHHRWLYSGDHARLDQSLGEYYLNSRYRNIANLEDMIERTYAQSGDTYRSVGERAGTTSPPSQAQVFQDFERRQTVLNAAGESVSKREDQLIEDLFPADMGICWYLGHGAPHSHSGPWYSFAFGAINDAALFVTRNKSFVQTSDESATLLYSIFEGYSIDKLMVASALERSLRFARVDVDPHLKSLKAISTAATMFRHFPYASVDVRILQRGLYNASWIRSCIGPQVYQAFLRPLDGPSFSWFDALDEPQTTLNEQRRIPSAARVPEPNLAAEEIYEPLPSLDRLHGTPVALLPYALSKPQAFACLAMFESGQHDIDPGQLIDVMAMSSGDSIYVSAALLTDPYDETLPGDIRGVMGNIGRPGITFLVPPKDPLIKQVSIDEWPLIERDEFDGCLSDHFQNTSLHLSFTTAETPINIGFSGGQDLEACILETLFSVYECGRWIADLNVSNLTTAKRLSRLCRCTTQHTAGSWHSNMTCIDSWLGLVDAPEDKVSLVRAHGNWQARLAASSISLALGYQTILLPNDVCWQCFDNFSRTYNTQIIAIG
ncbi:MAG: hypothetical protein L6R38_009471 [Xanthoria sp. 2 TBL-2021]|nr:MAG: hypothetical protein L6R38_009471 [Xanthoria sp. 2 TBL-2021]